MMRNARSYSYSDLNPDPTPETALIVDDESVFSQIENFLNTSKGERLFRLSDGGDPHALLFELAYDDDGAFALYSRIMTELPAAVPRAKLVPSKCVVIADPDNQRMDITLAFTIDGMGQQVHLFEAYLMNG